MYTYIYTYIYIHIYIYPHTHIRKKKTELSHDNRVVRLKGEGTVLLDPCELLPDALGSETVLGMRS